MFSRFVLCSIPGRNFTSGQKCLCETSIAKKTQKTTTHTPNKNHHLRTDQQIARLVEQTTTSNPHPKQQMFASSPFTQQTTQQQQQNVQQQQQQQQQPMMTMSTNIEQLENLYHESKCLMIGTDFNSSVTQHRLEHLNRSIPKNLASIYQQSQSLNEKKKKRVAEVGPKGDYLLSQKGFNVERYRNTLQRIAMKPMTTTTTTTTTTTAATSVPVMPDESALMDILDMDSFLKRQQSLVILRTIEDAKQKTSQQFYDRYEEFVKEDWEKGVKHNLKQQIIHSLPTTTMDQLQNTPTRQPHTGAASAFTPFSPSLSETSASFISPTPQKPAMIGVKMNERMIEYASVVKSVFAASSHTGYRPTTYNSNDNVWPEWQTVNWIERFKNVSQTENVVGGAGASATRYNSQQAQLVDCWNVLSCLWSDKQKSGLGVSVCGSIQALESQFFELLKHNVYQFMRISDSTNGGMSKLDIVQQYVTILTLNNQFARFGNLVRGDVSIGGPSVDIPVWSLVYHLIRCGLNQEAIQMLEQLKLKDERPCLTQLIQWNKSKSGPLVHTQEYMAKRSEIEDEQNKHGDTFLHVLYSVLAPDVSSHATSASKFFSTTEDWIWYKLNVKPLENLRAEILKYGPNHFTRPFDTVSCIRYFKLLLLTLQFDQAFDYLSSLQQEHETEQRMRTLMIDAVHFAIVCYQLDKSQDAHFTALIRDYVKLLTTCDVFAAIAYSALLLYTSDMQLFTDSMMNLILEIDNIGMLFGATASVLGGRSQQLLQQQQREHPSIMNHFPSDIYQSLLRSAIDTYGRRGLYKHQIMLLLVDKQRNIHVPTAETQDVVIISTTNLYLSQTIYQSRVQSLVEAFKFSLAIRDQLSGQNVVGHDEFETLNLLIQVAMFIVEQQQQQPQVAPSSSSSLSAVQKLKRLSGILPIEPGPTMTRYVERAKKDNLLAPLYSQLLILAARQAGNDSALIARLFEFAGSIPEHISAECFQYLLQLKNSVC